VDWGYGRYCRALSDGLDGFFCEQYCCYVGFGGSTNNLTGSPKRTVERLSEVTRRQRKLAVPPKPGDVIASNHTSPLDLLYLAAKFLMSCDAVDR
jgi:hypothetical protein